MTGIVHPKAFSSLMGQPSVKGFLENVITSDRVSHAYLFLGKPGSGKTDAAYAFAKALLCDKGGCCACDTCIRIQRRTHPDVHYLAPAGVAGYVVDQIRELVHDVHLAPVRARRKIYIIDRVDLLQGAPANAFLKTLEEPPANVTFLLLGRNRDAILQTVLSRCQVVPFRTIPMSQACMLLCEETGYDERDCRIALAAGGASITRARAYLLSSAEKGVRTRAIGVLDHLAVMDDLDVLDAASDIMEALKGPLADVRSAQESELKDGADYLGRSALKSLEERQKRELSAASRRQLSELFSIIDSWLRDCLVLCEGADESLVDNADDLESLFDLATRTSSGALTRAMGRVDEARTLVAYNVTPQLVIEDLLFELREVW